LCEAAGEPGEASCEQECEGDEEPCEGGLDGRLEVFGEASGSGDPAERPFDDPALWQDDEALDLLVIALDDGDGDAARLEGGALRLIAAIARIDETHRHERALAMRLAQEGHQRVAILDVGGRDLAFDRQAKGVDGDVPLATLDFLGGVEAARPTGLGRLDRLAVDDNRRRRGLAALRRRRCSRPTRSLDAIVFAKADALALARDRRRCTRQCRRDRHARGRRARLGLRRRARHARR